MCKFSNLILNFITVISRFRNGLLILQDQKRKSKAVIKFYNILKDD